MVLVLPTFLHFILTEPFLPDDHPWKYAGITWYSWARGAKPLLKQISLVFWEGIIFFTYIVLHWSTFWGS